MVLLRWPIHPFLMAFGFGVLPIVLNYADVRDSDGSDARHTINQLYHYASSKAMTHTETAATTRALATASHWPTEGGQGETFVSLNGALMKLYVTNSPHPLRCLLTQEQWWSAPTSLLPSVSSRVGSKLPLPLYADLRFHIPMTHRNDAGTWRSMISRIHPLRHSL